MLCRHMRKLCDFEETVKQLLALYVVPNLFIARDSGTIGHFYEDIANTLSILYQLFVVRNTLITIFIW